MTKISVIIPIYNAELYIERCARSLFEQTLTEIEYMFVDDCSSDQSITILNKVLEEYPERKNYVRIHRMKKNSGQAAVRKWGMENVSSEYAIHCDADDKVDLDLYEKMYNLAISENADVVVSDFMIVDGEKKNRVKGCGSTEPEKLMEGFIKQRYHWALWNKLFRSIYFKELEYPRGDMGEDALICLQLCRCAHKIAYLKDTYYYYYRNSTSITRNQTEAGVLRRFKQSTINGEQLLSFFKREGLYEKYADDIDELMYNKKNLLLPLVSRSEYYTLWKDTFSYLNKKVLVNKSISLKRKCIHLLILSHLYALLKDLCFFDNSHLGIQH